MRAGFSLLELLVVLLIIGVGWFSILPSLDLASSKERKDEYAELNAFMRDIREEALSSYRTQPVYLTIESDVLVWGDRQIELPEAILGCTVNNLDPSIFGKTFAFRVFRDGVMEKVRFELRGGTVLESDVVGVRFASPEEK